MAKPVLGVVIAAGLVGVSGSLFSSPWPHGVGCLVVLAVLVVHPVMTSSALPLASRLLCWGGLLGLGLGVLLQDRELVDWRSWAGSVSIAEILASGGYARCLRDQAIWALAEAGCQVLACAAFGLALARLRRPVSRVAAAGFMVLVVVAGIAVRDAASALAAVLAFVRPTGTAQLTGTAVASLTVSVDLFGAMVTAIMLGGAFLAVDGCARR